MRSVQRLLLAFTIALAGIAATVLPAAAHTVVLSAEPPDGAVLDTAPAEVRVVFNETIELLSVQLVEPGGAARTLDAQLINGTTIVARLPDDLAAGTHALSWRAISADGHPNTGSIVFSLGAPGEEVAIGGRDWLLSAAIWIARALFYSGLFIGAGGAAFSGWAGAVPARAKTYVWAALAGGLFAAIMGVGLQGADALGLGLGGVFSSVAWETGPTAGVGLQATLGAIAMILGGLRLSSLDDRGRLVTAIVIIAFVGACIAETGHASTADPQWLTRPAAFVHAASIAFWIGSLLPLAFLLAGGSSDALRRFSQAIPFAVLALLVSGIVLVTIQLGPPSSAWMSPYGFVLVTKLGLVAAILVLALRNRYALTGRSLAGDATATSKLRRAVLFETGLVLLVFHVVAGWRFTPPPRALAEATFVAAAAYGHAMQGAAMADIALEPSSDGSARLTVVLWDEAQMPLEAREVSVRLSAPLIGIEPFRRAAQLGDTGSWTVSGIGIPAPGLWRVQIEVLISDFEVLTLEGELHVAPD